MNENSISPIHSNVSAIRNLGMMMTLQNPSLNQPRVILLRIDHDCSEVVLYDEYGAKGIHCGPTCHIS